MDRHSAVEEEVVDRALEDVGERQEGERLVVLPQRIELLAGQDVRDEVPVRQDDALGVAGGAGGVDDARRVVLADPPAERREVGVRGRRRSGDQGFEVGAAGGGGLGIERHHAQTALLIAVLVVLAAVAGNDA